MFLNLYGRQMEKLACSAQNALADGMYSTFIVDHREVAAALRENKPVHGKRDVEAVPVVGTFETIPINMTLVGQSGITSINSLSA